jgi:hypothetical protein
MAILTFHITKNVEQHFQRDSLMGDFLRRPRYIPIEQDKMS